MKKVIQKSNQSNEALFWSSFFIGEIIAGIAIIATVFYVRQLKDQNKILVKSFEGTKIKNTGDTIQELESTFQEEKMNVVSDKITSGEKLIVIQGGALDENDLVNYLSLIGKIFLFYELDMLSLDHIDKFFWNENFTIKTKSLCTRIY